MNPWFGLIAGPLLAGLGAWWFRDPGGWASLNHLGSRLLYRFVGARYEGSRLERLTTNSVLFAGLIGIALGIAWFAVGLILLIER
jgi:hypothetical protein